MTRAGFAIQLGYDYDKFNWFGYNSSLRLVSEYQTHDFETVGTYMSPVNYSAYFAATYAQHLPWSLTGGVSFSYYYADHTSASAGDRWQADATLSAPLWDNISSSISLSYGRDQTADESACCAYNQERIPGLLASCMDSRRPCQRLCKLRQPKPDDAEHLLAVERGHGRRLLERDGDGGNPRGWSEPA